MSPEMRDGNTRFWKREVGAPVVIVVRCIAAVKAAGTVYEFIIIIIIIIIS
jgi:hypothetical protein